ncbi:MAG: site-specific integrase [Clostridiales bacterium]|nr:site-specific integrase [Clostridiales bacterium]
MAKRIRQRVMFAGEQLWVSGNTQQELFDQFLNIVQKSGMVGEPEPANHRTPSFEKCARQWFSIYKLPKLRHNTAYNYQRDMENHVLPVFGKRPIGDIKPSDIQEFLNSKQDKAHSTVKHFWLILHGVFSMAKWDGIIQRDPTEDVRYFTMSKKKTKREALSAEDAQDIIRNLPRLSPEDGLLLSLFIFSGMRRSEVLGLRWEDIDFREGILHVRRAVTFRNNQPVVGETKSAAGLRMIPLDPRLRQALLERRQIGGYVIGGENPISEKTFQRTWQRINRNIDLHGATAHIFRHTYITLAAPHIDIKTLQSIAGHADISTTMNRYAHGQAEKIASAGKELEGMFGL